MGLYTILVLGCGWLIKNDAFKRRFPDFAVFLLLIVTLSQIVEGYRVYSLADPLFFYALFTFQWHLVNFVTLLRLVTVGHCPTVLLLQFFGYLLLLSRKVNVMRYFFVFYSGIIMSWAIWIFQYVQYFYGIDFLHGLILVNAFILFLASAGLTVSKEQVIIFFMLGMVVGVVFPDLLLSLGKMLGFGYPVPSWYPWLFNLPFSLG